MLIADTEWELKSEKESRVKGLLNVRTHDCQQKMQANVLVIYGGHQNEADAETELSG